MGVDSPASDVERAGVGVERLLSGPEDSITFSLVSVGGCGELIVVGVVVGVLTTNVASEWYTGGVVLDDD